MSFMPDDFRGLYSGIFFFFFFQVSPFYFFVFHEQAEDNSGVSALINSEGCLQSGITLKA